MEKSLSEIPFHLQEFSQNIIMEKGMSEIPVHLQESLQGKIEDPPLTVPDKLVFPPSSTKESDELVVPPSVRLSSDEQMLPVGIDSMDNNPFGDLHAAQELIKHNEKILKKIDTNISSNQLQENIALLCHARDNINMLMNSMLTEKMPAMPEKLNEELLNSILLSMSKK